jgi:hypothetical protein
MVIEEYKDEMIKRLNEMRGNRTDVGGWGPACVQHGFMPYGSLTNNSYMVPARTGRTLDDVIGMFLEDPSSTPWLIESVSWPGNSGCSGSTSGSIFG